jgi:hypothetical protein
MYLISSVMRAKRKKTITKEVEITPLVKSLKGSFKAPEGFDHKKELEQGLASKYL